MAAASEYVLEPIRDGAKFMLYRARQHGDPSPVLVVAPTAEQPLPQTLRRLEHEYSLAAELDSAWAAKPLALTRLGFHVTEVTGGKSLHRRELGAKVLGQPFDHPSPPPLLLLPRENLLPIPQ
jgi:hypothetical protein